MASDCKVVIEAIKSVSIASYGVVVHEIREHSSAFVSCVSSHEFRTSNVEAYNLAKHAMTLGVGRA